MTTSHAPIRVFLLSDSRFVREALARVMRKAADIVVADARPYSVDVPAAIIDSSCDVLLTDSASLLALDSQASDRLRSSLSQLKVVVIEIDDDESVFSKLARKGVMAYLLKHAAVADVVPTVRSVVRGEIGYPPRFGMLRRPGEVSGLDPSGP